MMRVLLTGVAGFIGSHVCDRLVARGDAVVGLDNFDPFYAREIKERNLAGLRDRITFHEGDLRDRGLLDRVFAEHAFDAVVHLGALAGVRPSLADPARYQDVNVVGTARLVEAMAARGVRRLVFASSSSVYGHNTEVPYAESHRVDRPASPYAASKRAGELLLSSCHAIHRIDVSCLRFFTVYGPRQRPEMAIHAFCRRVDEGKPITLFGDGGTSRDYTYVDDVVDGTLGALDRAAAGFHVYNLGNTHPIALRDLVDRIGAAVGKTPHVEHAPLQPGDVMHTWAAIDAARRDLGYDPKVDIDEGLRRFVRWMRQV
jgi:UDP-glucuronate 4-epimerase